MSYPDKPTDWTNPPYLEYDKVKLCKVLDYNRKSVIFTAKCGNGHDDISQVPPINLRVLRRTVIDIASKADRTTVDARMIYDSVTKTMWDNLDICRIKVIYGDVRLADVVDIVVGPYM
jgi:hypothetical protein